MRKMKISFAIIFTLLICVGIFGFMTKVSAADEYASFKMQGASVRYKADATDTTNGLRFVAEMSVADYEKATTIKDVEMGMLIIPSDLLGGNPLTVDTAKVNKVVTYPFPTSSVGWGKDSEKGIYETKVALYNIPAAAYKRNLTARAYIKTGSDVVYADALERSIASVALELKKLPGEAAHYDELNTYLQCKVTNETAVVVKKDSDTVTDSVLMGDLVTLNVEKVTDNNTEVFVNGESVGVVLNGKTASINYTVNGDFTVTTKTVKLSALKSNNYAVNGNVIDKISDWNVHCQDVWKDISSENFVYTVEVNEFSNSRVGCHFETWLWTGLEKSGSEYKFFLQGNGNLSEFPLHPVNGNLELVETQFWDLPADMNTAETLFASGKAKLTYIGYNGFMFLLVNDRLVSNSGIVAVTNNSKVELGLYALGVAQSNNMFASWDLQTGEETIKQALSASGLMRTVSYVDDGNLSVTSNNQKVENGGKVVVGDKVNISVPVTGTNKVLIKVNGVALANTVIDNGTATASIDKVMENATITYQLLSPVNVVVPLGVTIVKPDGTPLAVDEIAKDVVIKFKTDVIVTDNNLGFFVNDSKVAHIRNGQQLSSEYVVTGDCTVVAKTIKLSEIVNRGGGFIVNTDSISKNGNKTGWAEELWTDMNFTQFSYTLEISEFTSDQDAIVGAFFNDWLRIGLLKVAGQDLYKYWYQGGVNFNLNGASPSTLPLPETMNNKSELFVNAGKVKITFIAYDGLLYLYINDTYIAEVAKTNGKSMSIGLLTSNLGAIDNLYTNWDLKTGEEQIVDALSSSVTFDAASGLKVTKDGANVATGDRYLFGTELKLEVPCAASDTIAFVINGVNQPASYEIGKAVFTLTLRNDVELSYVKTSSLVVTLPTELTLTDVNGNALDASKVSPNSTVKFKASSAITHNHLGIIVGGKQVAMIKNGETLSSEYTVTASCTVTTGKALASVFSTGNFAVNTTGTTVNKITEDTTDGCQGWWNDIQGRDNFVYTLVINEAAYTTPDVSIGDIGVGAFFEPWLRVGLQKKSTEGTCTYQLYLQGGASISGPNISGGSNYYDLPDAINEQAEVFVDGKATLTFALYNKRLYVLVNGVDSTVVINVTGNIQVGLFARQLKIFNDLYLDWDYQYGNAQAYLVEKGVISA